MTIERKNTLEKFINELPAHFHQLRKRQMEDGVNMKLASSKNYKTNGMHCLAPHKPISRLLKIQNEKNP